MAATAVLVVFLGIVAGGYLYISRVAAGVGRVPVMFAPVSASTPPQTPAVPGWVQAAGAAGSLPSPPVSVGPQQAAPSDAGR
jgi:hypothetical protein